MKGTHKIIVEEVITRRRVVTLNKSDYGTVLKAEFFVYEALENLYANQVGEPEAEETEILINGVDMDEFKFRD